jgi:LytS/YehU family sensor histidine kinase
MNIQLKKFVFAALLLALCIILPFLTGNNRQLGVLLSLMHIPVLICGFVCGPYYGFLIGAQAPLIRSFFFGMPPFPNIALPMALELAAYGLIVGFLHQYLPKKYVFMYLSLIIAMVAGRLVNLLVSLNFGTEAALASFYALFAGTLPGIAIQIILVPIIVAALNKSGVLSNDNTRS